MSIVTPWLALLALLFAQRTFQRYLQSTLLLLLRRSQRALLVYALILLPGVLLHEAAHWFTARLLGVRTLGLSLLPRATGDRRISLGYMETVHTDPLRAAFIGLAPLVLGLTVLALIVSGPLGLRETNAVAAGAWGEVLRWPVLVASRPDAAWWLYLAMAVSNTMMPSEADRRAWLWVAAAGLLLALLLAGLGDAAALWQRLEPGLTALGEHLTAVLLFAAVLDLVLSGGLWLATWILSRLTGLEVVRA